MAERPRAVHAAHCGQVVAAAQIHGVHRLLEQVGGGKIVAAAVDVRRGEDFVAGAGGKAAAFTALAGNDDFFQGRAFFGFFGRLVGVGIGGAGKSQRQKQRQAAGLGQAHIVLLVFRRPFQAV